MQISKRKPPSTHRICIEATNNEWNNEKLLRVTERELFRDNNVFSVTESIDSLETTNDFICSGHGNKREEVETEFTLHINRVKLFVFLFYLFLYHCFFSSCTSKINQELGNWKGTDRKYALCFDLSYTTLMNRGPKSVQPFTTLWQKHKFFNRTNYSAV